MLLEDECFDARLAETIRKTEATQTAANYDDLHAGIVCEVVLVLWDGLMIDCSDLCRRRCAESHEMTNPTQFEMGFRVFILSTLWTFSVIVLPRRTKVDLTEGEDRSLVGRSGLLIVSARLRPPNTQLLDGNASKSSFTFSISSSTSQIHLQNSSVATSSQPFNRASPPRADIPVHACCLKRRATEEGSQRCVRR